MALSYHNIGRRCAGCTLFIIPTLCIRTTYAADLGTSYVQPTTQHLQFNLGLMMEYHYETLHIDSIVVEAMGFGLRTRGIGLLLT